MRKTLCVAAIVAAFSATAANAAPVQWTIQSSASSLTVAGSAVAFALGFPLGLPLSAQFTDSNKAPYGGYLLTDVDDLTNPTTVEFLSASADAIVNATPVQPKTDGTAGTDPGDYGLGVGAIGSQLIFAALRNVIFDVTSGILPLIPGGLPSSSTFLATGTTPTSLSLDASYNAVAAGLGTGAFGSTSIAGQSLGNASKADGSASLVVQPGQSTLTLPVVLLLVGQVNGADTTVITDDIFVDLTISGQFQGTAVIPEPSSLALLGIGAVGLAFASYRRLRK